MAADRASLRDSSAVDLGADTKAVLLGAGLMFLFALVLGVWKYRQMATSESHLAHPYVDTAHRAALLYSFATLLIAAFVQFSGWSELVDVICAGVLYFFFLGAVLGYAYHGWRRDTDNQFRDPAPSAAAVHGYMVALIVGEIAAFAVLLAGFVDGQIL
jgi:TRAP-type C4-dicarboxylate transport system permease large subunit